MHMSVLWHNTRFFSLGVIIARWAMWNHKNFMINGATRRWVSILHFYRTRWVVRLNMICFNFHGPAVSQSVVWGGWPLKTGLTAYGVRFIKIWTCKKNGGKGSIFFFGESSTVMVPWSLKETLFFFNLSDHPQKKCLLTTRDCFGCSLVHHQERSSRRCDIHHIRKSCVTWVFFFHVSLGGMVDLLFFLSRTRPWFIIRSRVWPVSFFAFSY